MSFLAGDIGLPFSDERLRRSAQGQIFYTKRFSISFSGSLRRLAEAEAEGCGIKKGGGIVSGFQREGPNTACCFSARDR